MGIWEMVPRERKETKLTNLGVGRGVFSSVQIAYYFTLGSI